VRVRDGHGVRLRPVRVEDRDRVQAAIRSLSSEWRDTRFMTALRDLTPQMLERAVHPQVDREREPVAVHGETHSGRRRWASR
jgi:hypothetical protein